MIVTRGLWTYDSLADVLRTNQSRAYFGGYLYIQGTQQQTPESPRATFAWHVSKYKDHKLHQGRLLIGQNKANHHGHYQKLEG